MRCRFGNASITNFNQDIGGLEGFGKSSFGFGNVAGVPVDGGGFVTGWGGFVRCRDVRFGFGSGGT